MARTHFHHLFRLPQRPPPHQINQHPLRSRIHKHLPILTHHPIITQSKQTVYPRRPGLYHHFLLLMRHFENLNMQPMQHPGLPLFIQRIHIHPQPLRLDLRHIIKQITQRLNKQTPLIIGVMIVNLNLLRIFGNQTHNSILKSDIRSPPTSKASVKIKIIPQSSSTTMNYCNQPG